MQEEIWKDVIDYEGIYQVSNLGNVKSLKFNKEKILKLMPRSGYLRVELNQKSHSVHRLVLHTFVGLNETKPQVNHINGIKSDNRLINLEWVTQSENIRHAINTGLKIAVKGEKIGTSKLKNHEVIEIRKSLLSSRKLAIIYGVDKSVILDVKNYHTWKHI